MKGFKKFLFYFAIIFGSLLVITLIFFGVMFLSPNTSILGFEYVSFNNQVVKEYNLLTEPTIGSITAFEITTENSDIYIYPNSESEDLKLDIIQKHSGLAKSVNAQLQSKLTVEDKSFEEKEQIFKTFKAYFDEPTGWISTNGSKIIIYIPTSLSLNTIYAKSLNGNVFYCSTKDETSVSCSNLYLKAFGAGNVEINNDQMVLNYYLATDKGNISFANINTINANLIKLESDTGCFNFSNKDGTATINSSLKVNSNNAKGPTIVIDNLNGSLYSNIKNGTFDIKNIGSFGNYQNVAISTSKSKINLGTVFGNVSILANTSAEKNNITINTLNSISQINQFEVGSGNLQITNLDGNVSAEASSGNISILQSSVESSIYVYTLSGSININYDYSTDNNEDSSLKILTNKGNLMLTNISCFLDVKVLENSAKKTVDISFAGVCCKDNILDLRDRKASIKLVGSSDYLAFRLLSQKQVEFIGSMIESKIGVLDEDNNFGVYNDYLYKHRLGYLKDDGIYNGNYIYRGILLISSSDTVTFTSENL